MLLTYHADVNAKDQDGATPLHWAVKNGHKDVVELLLASNADVNAKESKVAKTPLHFAAEEGHSDIAKMLLAWKADVNAEERKYGQTAMQLAATEGHSDVAELLRWHHAKLSAPLPPENQKPLTTSSPNPDRVEDIRKVNKWWRQRAIIFIVPTLIVLGGLALLVVKLMIKKYS